MLKPFALAFCLLLPFAARAEFNCPDPQKILALSHEFEILKTSPRVNTEMCGGNSMLVTLAKSLGFLRELGNLEPVPARSPDWIGASPYEFFKARVKKIVLDDGDDCVGLAQVWPSERAQGIIHLCTRARDYDSLVLSEALVHERRHLENEPHDHVTCWSGQNYRRESCDESYEEGGAYAVGVEYLMRISQTTRLDRPLRDRARELALTALRERFNTATTMELSLHHEQHPKIFR